MSDELNPDGLEALSAAIGFNDGANKGFWRFQPREKVGEDAGQWIEMGAELRMFYKNKRGETDSVVGRAVGSTGSPDGVRVLVQGQGDKGVADGIYGADTANVRIAAAILPDEVLEEQGIKNTIKISPEQEALLPTLDSLERADITDGDLRLINEGADSAEAKEQAVYKKSVQAKEKKTISPEAIEQMRKGLEKMKQLNLGLSDKIKALFPNFKKSKMNNPSLTFYSRSKRETYGQGSNPIVVPGGDYGRFSYFDEDGQLQSISVDKLADGRMRVNTYDRNIGEGLALEVRLNKDSGKWGVYSKSDGDGTYIGGELLNEFDSSEDARSAAISGINEALGFDPDNRFSLGPGITALRKRNENPRTKSQRDWVDVKPSPEFTSLMDARDQAAADVMADVQYNGDVDPDVDIDVLIDRAKKPVALPDPDEEDDALPGTPTLPTQKAPAGTTLKWGDEWKRGDTLFSPSGKEIGTVLGNSTAITNAKGQPGYAVNIQNADGNIETIRVAKDDGLYVSKTKKKDLPADPGSAATPKAPAAPATPSKPAAPAAPPADVTPPAPAAPAAPAKPAAPTKPAAPQPGLPDSEKPKKKKAEDKALRSGREDDGKPIAPTTMTNDELREIVPANVRDEVTGKLIKDDNGRPSQDPDAIIDALLETHPNAKVTKEGEIILERARFTDNDGQQYDYEIGISRTFNNSFSERWSFTNVATGEKQEFFSVDQKDSFSGIW
jgi:hypothetical protein